MHRSILTAAAVGLAALAASGQAAALGPEAMEVQAARMNALAGGPTNARDAELLERYGCESGTRSAFCQGLNHPRRYYRPRRRAYQH
jgi:ABC-type proline/glycine betaine transport system substrate-binding protein